MGESEEDGRDAGRGGVEEDVVFGRKRRVHVSCWFEISLDVGLKHHVLV